ncbi:hypothetical protein GGR55DRAFT_70607 [Xylaria sp. FL0064]|nr:hypothetical protein GGR55DRAFT_70607 [Xylaria sp. FL0064]
MLYGGTVLCCEVADNFPSAAGGFPSRFETPSWVETGSLSPSGLSESDVIQTTISSHLQKAGFSTGVCHCEARMLGSRSAYLYQSSGYPRLKQAIQHDDSMAAAIAVIEINTRPPGYQTSEESLFSMGVDYYALQYLMACGDSVRYAALAQPISPNVAWWGSGFLAAERGGIFYRDTIFEELQVRPPALMKHVVR